MCDGSVEMEEHPFSRYPGETATHSVLDRTQTLPAPVLENHTHDVITTLVISVLACVIAAVISLFLRPKTRRRDY
jgi:hypothetical protein